MYHILPNDQQHHAPPMPCLWGIDNLLFLHIVLSTYRSRASRPLGYRQRHNNRTIVSNQSTENPLLNTILARHIRIFGCWRVSVDSDLVHSYVGTSLIANRSWLRPIDVVRLTGPSSDLRVHYLNDRGIDGKCAVSSSELPADQEGVCLSRWLLNRWSKCTSS
jgi:hypothetical protein